MAKKMISIRFDESLLKHLKDLQEVKIDGLTAYLEKASAKLSKYERWIITKK